jgi:hypothetical protein
MAAVGMWVSIPSNISTGVVISCLKSQFATTLSKTFLAMPFFFFAQTMPVEISDFQLFSNLSFDGFVMHDKKVFFR